MSIKLKNIGILFFMTLLYTGVVFSIYQYIILPGFLSLEVAEAKKNLRRPCQAIKREIHYLNSFIHDWSAWSETYKFAITKSLEYLKTNVTYSTFHDNGINMIIFCDAKGMILWRGSYDLSTAKAIHIPEIPEDSFPSDSPLISYPKSVKDLSKLSVSGLISTSNGPMLLASRPILNNNNEGPVRGSLIMGKFLTDEIVKKLAEQTEVDFTIIPVGTYKLNSDLPSLSLLQNSENTYLSIINKKSLAGYSLLTDIAKKPAIIVKIIMARDIADQAYTTMRYSLIFTIIAGLFVLVVMVSMLHITTIKPISIMAKHTRQVGNTGDLSARLNFKRKDEIGSLALRLDTMLDQLAKTRRTLVEQSYYSGLAGVSSDILHNTRNILMPVSEKLSTILEKCESTPVEAIKKTVAELDQNHPKQERRQELIRYLCLSATHLLELSQNAKEQLNDISGHISEIETMLINLDDYSHSQISAEYISPADIIKQAISTLPCEYFSAIAIEVSRRTGTLPVFLTERITIVTVIVTAISHIAHMFPDASEIKKRINIDAFTEEKTDNSFLHLIITGINVKISQEDLSGLFNRNFNKQSTSGNIIGLHWCSNVISAIGGMIFATRGNDNKDLVFHLLLKIRQTDEY